MTYDGISWNYALIVLYIVLLYIYLHYFMFFLFCGDVYFHYYNSLIVHLGPSYTNTHIYVQTFQMSARIIMVVQQYLFLGS